MFKMKSWENKQVFEKKKGKKFSKKESKIDETKISFRKIFTIC